MSISEYVVLDANVFDSQQYNFESTGLKAFVVAVKQRNITLLLPSTLKKLLTP
jgi:hypothetical protein